MNPAISCWSLGRIFMPSRSTCSGRLDLKSTLSKPIDLPGGGSRHQGWHILARAGGVDITIVLSLVETMEQRSITPPGSSALAQLDFGNDCLVVERNNTADLTANPLVRSLSLAAQHLREGLVNVHRQTASLGRKSPYALGFQGAVRGFYDGISTGRQLDPRFGGEAALLVMQAIEATLAKMPAAAAPPVLIGRPAPKVMVIGNRLRSGCNLTRTLVARGHDVRVLSRSRSGPFDDIADHVETVPVALTDHEGLRAAMAGIDTVYNLAKSTDKSSWPPRWKMTLAPPCAWPRPQKPPRSVGWSIRERLRPMTCPTLHR